jgi:mannose-6-phosphate isomerase-like protein (cupin superfamily)
VKETIVIKTSSGSAVPYVTKDGSIIRELIHPDVHGNACQSLAEAILPAGGRSLPHRHLLSEEIYYIIEGEGRLTVGLETIAVGPGDAVCIPPRMLHWIENTGSTSLRFLCCASPPYRHEDTQLLVAEAG